MSAVLCTVDQSPYRVVLCRINFDELQIAKVN